jgi:hypothetical protein
VRYVVRQGYGPGGEYWDDGPERWTEYQARATGWECREDAKKVADDVDSRVVRILSPEEAKRKFAASKLRELAENVRRVFPPEFRLPVVVVIEREADALWPAKRKAGRRG